MEAIHQYKIINEVAGTYVNINYSVFGFTDAVEEHTRNVYDLLKAYGIIVTVVERAGNIKVDMTITI